MYNFVFIYFEFGDWSGESDVAAAVGGEDVAVGVGAAAGDRDGLIVSLERLLYCLCILRFRWSLFWILGVPTVWIKLIVYKCLSRG